MGLPSSEEATGCSVSVEFEARWEVFFFFSISKDDGLYFSYALVKQWMKGMEYQLKLKREV